MYVEPDKLWLDREVPPAVNIASQETHLAQLPDIFRAFGEAWADRWLRHTNVEPSRWQQALQVIDQVLSPGEPMPYRPIAVQQWKQAVRAKRPSSALGPDGVCRADLLIVPDNLSRVTG